MYKKFNLIAAVLSAPLFGSNLIPVDSTDETPFTPVAEENEPCKKPDSPKLSPKIDAETLKKNIEAAIAEVEKLRESIKRADEAAASNAKKAKVDESKEAQKSISEELDEILESDSVDSGELSDDENSDAQPISQPSITSTTSDPHEINTDVVTEN